MDVWIDKSQDHWAGELSFLGSSDSPGGSTTDSAGSHTTAASSSNTCSKYTAQLSVHCSHLILTTTIGSCFCHNLHFRWEDQSSERSRKVPRGTQLGMVELGCPPGLPRPSCALSPCASVCCSNTLRTSGSTCLIKAVSERRTAYSSMWTIVLPATKDSFSFISSFPIRMTFISFSCLIAVARTSRTVLNKNDDSKHPCFIPELRVNALSLSPLNTKFDVGFMRLK